MAFDRFLIAPFNSGLQTDLKSWMIPEDAFESLENAYVFRGRVRKRFGSVLMGSVLQSRFRIGLGINANMAINLPGIASQLQIGQMFSLGTDVFQVYQLGNGVLTLSTNAGVTATINSTTNPNTITFSGGALSTVYYYPSLPVMGLTQYELGAINNHISYGFDQQFAYQFTVGVGWDRAGVGTMGSPFPIFHGTDLQYFWTTNWDGLTPDVVVLYVTNFNAHIGLGLVTDDPIWTLNGNTWTPYSYSPTLTLNPSNLQPITVTTTGTNGTLITNYIQQALIILPFKDRLIMLNTIENNSQSASQYDPANETTTGITPAIYLTSTNTQFKNRCRYSHNGSPFAANAWLEQNQIYTPAVGGTQVVADGAGFIDAATEEGIVSAEFIKDRLIVYFERSTWELAYTGNEILPFVWQKINTELGSQATLSTVPFDTSVLTIGNTGVHSCNGANVERIDNKIPSEIFTFKVENNEQLRTAGIRDYQTELVYWSFVSDDNNALTDDNDAAFPDKILVYNYANGSWSTNDDCITAYGYFEQSSDATWNSAIWGIIPWEEANFAWNSGLSQAQQRLILGGTQQGFVFILAPGEDDVGISRNASSMSITNMTIPSATLGSGYVDLEIMNHNLFEGDYIALENLVGVTATQIIYQVAFITDKDDVIISDPNLTITGAYLGGGTIARVSNINILSKRWNPYVNKDRNVYVQRIDFGVQSTAYGQVTIDYYASSAPLSMINEAANTNCSLGNSILETSPYALYTMEAYSDLLFHPIYFQTQGQFIQINMYMSYDQMINTNITWSNFEIQAMTLYTQPTTYRLE